MTAPGEPARPCRDGATLDRGAAGGAGPSVWPPGAGEMAARTRAHEWANTPLGPVEAWPERLKAIVELLLAHDAPMVALWGAELVQIYNDGYRALMGDKHPAGLGQPTRLCWPEVWHINAPIYERVRAGETLTREAEPYPVARYGRLEEAWFTLTYSPLRDGSGAVAGVLVTALETTVRRDRVEAGSREDEARFRGLVEGWAQAVWEADAQGRVVTGSPSWCAYTGQNLQEWLGDGWVDAIHPEDRAYAERQWREAVAARRPVDAELRLRHAASGGWRWTNVRVVPLAGPDGGVRKWVGMNIDVHDRKLAEAALRENEARYRALFERMDEAYAVVEVVRDDAGRWSDFLFVEVNPAFVHHTGMPDPVGRTATQVLGRPNPRWAEVYGRVAETGEAVRFEDVEPTLGRVFDLNVFRLGGPGSRRVAVLFTDITARRRAETALRESEARFRALATAGSYAVYRMSPDWGEMRHLDGRGFIADTPDPSRSWPERYIHPDDRAEVWAAIHDAIRAKRVFELEHRVVRADGTLGWTLSRAVPLLDEAGEIAEWFGAASDVTARKQAEERLRESEARLAAVFEGLPVGVGVFDAGGGLVLSNREMRRFMPTAVMPSRDEARCSRWRAWHPDGRPVEPCDFPGARALRGERVVPGLEMLYTDDDGAEIWTNVTAVPIEDGEGRATGQVVAVIADIDASKRAVEALRESEERFRQFAEASSDLLWIRDAHTLGLEYLSPAFEAIYGRGREAVLDGDGVASWADLVHPDDRERVLDGLARLRAGERVQQEFRITRPDDGAVRWISNTAFALRDAHGRVRRIAGIAHDATEEKTAAERMGVMVAELQHRTRNLIAVVRSIAAQTMAVTGPTEAFREQFDDRLGALSRVQGLLSRAEEEPITVDALIRGELDALGAGVDGSDGRVKLDGPRVRVRNSVVQTLALALHELATNARKHGALAGEEGRLRVTWRVCESDGDGRRLVLEWVEDTAGRPVPSADPGRVGYGRELIERALPYALGARTSYTLGEHGVRCTIDLPLERPRSRRRSG